MASNTKETFGAKDVVDTNMTANILAVYSAVTEGKSAREILTLENWYVAALAWCASVAQTYNLHTEQVVGIVAALSPQLSWEKNKAQALRFIEFCQEGKELKGFMAYPANIAKARRIYDGESPLSVLGGRKVRSFYRNILLDYSVVTVDRHALHIAMYGTGNPEKTGSIVPSDKLYGMVENAYLRAAGILNIAGYAVQSATWTFKALNGGKVE